jgi:hypothetical protein
MKADVTEIIGSQRKKAPEERNVYRIEASFPAPFRCSRMKADVAAIIGSQRKKRSRGATCLLN